MDEQNAAEDLTQVPPHDDAAEVAVLGGILLDSTALDRLTFLEPADFYSTDHRMIYGAMRALHAEGSGVTLATLHNQLKRTMSAADLASDLSVGLIRMSDYLHELIEYTPSAAYVVDHARIVKATATQRAVVDIGWAAQDGATPDDLFLRVDLLKDKLSALEAPTRPSLSMADLLAEPAEAEPWLVDKLLPEGGTSLVASKPGTGKSTLARDLALAVAQGRPWLGRMVKQGPALILALEEHKRQVTNHLTKMGAKAADPVHVWLDPVANPIEALRAEAEEIRPALIVIDPLARFVNVQDMNDYSQVSRALDPLIRLAHETGAHVMLIHHAKKGELNEDSYLGSTALSASVDTVLHLDLELPSRARTLSAIKQRSMDADFLEPTVIGFDPYTGHIEAQGSKAEAVQRSIQDDILRLVEAADDGIKRADIIDRVEGSARDINKVLIVLREAGQIVKEKRGKPDFYTLPAVPVSTVSDTAKHRTQEAAKASEDAASMSCVSVFKETQDIDTATRGPNWVENVDGHYVSIDRPRKDEDMSLNERADEAMQSPAVRQMIDTHWMETIPPAPEPYDPEQDAIPAPEPGTPAYAAMLLDDLLFQRGMTPKQVEIMNRHRREPYDRDRNAAAIVECMEALTAAPRD